jgi:hypothetical protein
MYAILDWGRRKYCWVSVKIPDNELPSGIVCRSARYLVEGELDLSMDWTYEESFARYEKNYLIKHKKLT